MNGFTTASTGLRSFLADAAAQDDVVPRTPLLGTPAPPPAAPVQQPAAQAQTTPPTTDSAAHGNALDAATVDRAHQVYLGLTERGMDPTTALGFAANAVQESRADPGTGAGDMGASHGLLQWRGDRLTGYVDKYGHAPEKGDLSEQLDYIMHEVSGPEAGAWKSILASAPDPASRAAAVSQYFERPKDTQAEIARRGYIAMQLANHFAQRGA